MFVRVASAGYACDLMPSSQICDARLDFRIAGLVRGLRAVPVPDPGGACRRFDRCGLASRRVQIRALGAPGAGPAAAIEDCVRHQLVPAGWFAAGW